MPHDNRRSDRVAEAIREEVATFLSEGARDPRIQGMVTVTSVELTRDLRHGKVYVSVLGTDAERAATFEGLASVATHLRSRLGRALRLRVAPEITFREDLSVARASHMEALLSELRASGEMGPPDDAAGTANATPEDDGPVD